MYLGLGVDALAAAVLGAADALDVLLVLDEAEALLAVREHNQIALEGTLVVELLLQVAHRFFYLCFPFPLLWRLRALFFN